MSIQILSPQLTNQIAAGEVVERPASIVKELIENSLDAGATEIHIDIEQGGCKLIRIRDNGCGIGKEELALALARHATSKISCLEDLNNIMSLGFRGEALASISSVARLTLTSRPVLQSEAWQAYAEGRDMQVAIKPAAHPVGTTIEVLDLFYNTPARRRFLRTEKTEFSHIDEVIKRIALAKWPISFHLSHNGKSMKHYRAMNDLAQQQAKRLEAICGKAFVQQAIRIKKQYESLAISAWVALPSGEKPLPDLQYCYVNGRVVRDRLITHAIRQAYQPIDKEKPLAYVIYIDIDPEQLDVNVHPAKHEVRFHQTRLVHDFIYQSVNEALIQQADVLADGQKITEINQMTSRQSAGENRFTPLINTRQKTKTYSSDGQKAYTMADRYYSQPKPTMAPRAMEKTLALYQQIISPADEKSVTTNPDALSATILEKPLLFPEQKKAAPEGNQTLTIAAIGKVLTIWQQCYAIVEYHDSIALLALNVADVLLKRLQLTPQNETLISQPLLVPLMLTLTASEQETYQRYQEWLIRLGINSQLTKDKLEISAVAPLLRQQNLSLLLPNMLRFLNKETTIVFDAFVDWLAKVLRSDHPQWNQSQAITLLAELERLMPEHHLLCSSNLLQPIELERLKLKLNHE